MVGTVEFEAVDLLVGFGVVDVAAVFDKANHELRSTEKSVSVITFTYRIFTMAS